MEVYIGGALLVVAFLLTVIFRSANVKRRRRRSEFDALLASRPPLSAAEFAVECEVPDVIADRVRRVLAAVSEGAYANPRKPVEADRLRPDDDVCQQLGYDLDSLSFFELINGLETEFGVQMHLNCSVSREVSQVVR